MLKNQRLTLALALALGSGPALALGLGAIEVKSGLNEPLVAEIAIVSASPAELENLRVRLASPESFARVGATRPAPVSTHLDFAVDRNASGEAVIRVTSSDKLRDPYLSFMLEVEWNRGRLLREYTVLLDPPASTPIRVVPSARAPAAEPATAPALPPPGLSPPPAAQPSAAVERAPPAPRPVAEPASPPAASAPPAARPAPAAPAPAAATSTPDRLGPVTSGQTLWSLAQQLRPAGVDANQAMLGLLRANPDAFIDGNINRLKTGAVLRIPSREEFAALGAAEAAAQVRDQDASWRRRATPQQPVDTGAVAVAPGRARPAEPVDSRLEVVPPGGEAAARAAQSGAASAAEGRELRAEVARAREQVTTLEQENRELRSRVTDLEKIEGDARRLIALKDSELAEAQRRLAELQARRDATAASPSPAAQDDPVAVTTPEPGAAGAGESEGDRAVADATGAAASDASTGLTSDEMAAVAPRPARERPARPERPATATPVAATPPPPPPPPPAPWYRNSLVLGGGAVLLLGILALATVLGLRRRRGNDWRGGQVATTRAAGPVAAAVPVVAEDHEGQRLFDAVAEQPDDLDRHLALVRHYYEQGDAGAFEGAAEAMHAQLLDADDPAWQQVVAMGRELLPDHPLFAPAADEEFIEELHAGETASTGYPRAAVDWTPPAAAPPPPSFADTRSFSTDELDRIAAERSSEPAGSGYDLPVEPAPADEPAFGADEVAEDTGGDGDDAASTKLELARAYLDMGDVEGARGMLEEVVGEGNADQRSEARRLLDEIR
jgi:pilus assembly protein FimV